MICSHQRDLVQLGREKRKNVFWKHSTFIPLLQVSNLYLELTAVHAAAAAAVSADAAPWWERGRLCVLSGDVKNAFNSTRHLLQVHAAKKEDLFLFNRPEHARSCKLCEPKQWLHNYSLYSFTSGSCFKGLGMPLLNLITLINSTAGVKISLP